MTFDVAFERERAQLLSFARYRVRSRELAEDLVQETAFRGFRAWDGFRRELSVGNWLRGILARVIIDDARRRVRRPQEYLECECPAMESGDSINLDELAVCFDVHFANQPLSSALANALEAIPPKCRLAVEAMVLEDLGVDECAERMGIRPGTVRSRTHRGVSHMRRRLTGPR